ncbi:hypothetical protein AB0J84_11190 [Micromonospora arborensis]|uniref:hypothetical protein n=1 Tax=Micromonospora arborensis TaxID=2116518 RepID=UPI0034141AC7
MADDVGYPLMEHAEGPFAVLYGFASQSAVWIQLHEDPYGRSGFDFEPHPATLVTVGLSLVTIVTPDADSFFSRGILDALLLGGPAPGEPRRGARVRIFHRH